jgi:hypothetical protein
MGTELCGSWLATTDAITGVFGWLGGGKCNVGWTILTAASCLADSLVSASTKGSFQSPSAADHSDIESSLLQQLDEYLPPGQRKIKKIT